MTTLMEDVRYGLRALARTRGFTLLAVLTLAVGIGGNAAVFSLIDAVLLRQLPFADPGRLVNLYEHRNGQTGPISGHEFAAWREQNTAFQSIASYLHTAFNVTGGGDPEVLRALSVSSNYFDVLGVSPAMGRTFRSGEDRAGSNRVAVLSSRLWHRRFAADPSIVGRPIVLDNQPHEIVGVMTPRGDLDPDVWVPVDLPLEIQRVGKHSMSATARLAEGVTIERARADLDVVARHVERDFPGASTGHRVSVVALHEDVAGGVRRPAWVALGAVAFVLLIACANVAHLLLMRASARQKEIAVRAALGASRARLIRHLLVESVLVALMGGAAGLLLAAWVVDLLPALIAVDIPRLGDMRIDTRIIGATLIVSLLTGLLSGLFPALRTSRLDGVVSLQDGARGSAAAPARIAAVLVVSEVALALVLVIGSGLMIQSFVRLIRVDPGFNAENVLTVPLALPAMRYTYPQQRVAAVESLVERIRALPGVTVVGGTTQLPLAPGENRIAISIEGQPPARPGEERRAGVRAVTADYFSAMKIPLRSGRHFSASDARVSLPLIRWFPQQRPYPRYDEPQPPPVALINETMARRFWPGEDPLNRKIRILSTDPVTIVGIVGDVRHAGLAAAPQPELYLAHTQEPAGALTLLVRTSVEPMRLAGAVREQIRALDKDLPVAEMRTMEEILSTSVGRPRFDTLLLGTFGAVALLLSAIGIYGVTSHSVAQRTREIGIRTALGANPRAVLRLVLGRALSLTVAGIGAGLIGAWALTHLLATLLFEITTTDLATFAGVSVLLAVVSTIASYIPARRAMRVDPLIALKTE